MTKARAILWGGLFVGLFDILDAIIYFGIRNGASPYRISQSIARGLLGRDAFTGGAASLPPQFATAVRKPVSGASS